MGLYQLPRSVRVLIIDDDEDDFILTSAMLADLRTTSFSIDWAEDLASARQVLAEDRHDVCLLDYRLGAEDGLVLLRENIKQGFSGPIIMLTGHGDTEIDILATRLGAADYLVKGQFDAAMLERTLRYALAQKGIERERVQNLRDQQARREAESANRAKDELLAMVAHELRSPLQSLSLWATALRQPQVSEDTLLRGTEAIAKGVERLSFLVDDLMDASRIVAGQLSVERLRVRPVSLAREVVESLQPRAQEKQVDLTFLHMPGNCEILADARRFQQVVENLVTNAIKFTPASGRVEVELYWDAETLSLEVRDTGAGIPPSALGQIFERYQRNVQRDPSGSQGGLGLGLAIARHIVVLHGGRIHVESDGLGKGATFLVQLPLETSEAACAQCPG